MTRKRKVSLTIAAGVFAALTGVTMIMRHQTVSPEHARVRADALGTESALTVAAMTKALHDAGVPDTVEVRSAGDIVILRGTADPAAVASAIATVKSLGAKRVANLITADQVADDEGIRREAERQLARNRALDGCTIAVSCTRGVVRVTGRVQYELQKDAARQALRGISGVREVQVLMDLSKS